MLIESALAQAAALMRDGQHDAVRQLCNQVIATAPFHPVALFLLGIANAELADYSAAIQNIERVFAIEPAQPAANRLVFANILLDAGFPTRAEEQVRRALQDSPISAPALNLLGVSLYRQGHVHESLTAYADSIAKDPAYSTAHLNLALTLAELDRIEEAIACQRRVVELKPSSAIDHFRLGHLLHRNAHVFDAIDSYRQALLLDPENADWWVYLANALTDATLLADARNAYREALRLRPSYPQVESTLLVNLHYDPSFDRDAMLDAHRQWASRHAGGLPSVQIETIKAIPGDSRIRVGFLSPALRAGPTGTLLSPLLKHLDRERFKIFIYNANGVRDVFTERLQASADRWVDLWSDDDEVMAKTIAADGIDVLLDLAGHTPGGRPLVLARRPAFVIATWLDYFDTTGVPEVDYLIGDFISTPASEARYFTERIINIDPCRLCYEPPAYAPEVSLLPFYRNGFITFGSFNRLSKLTAPVVGLWAEVMQAVPASRLLLKNAAFGDARMRQRLLTQFSEAGITSDRITLRPNSPHQEMLSEYGDMDIALDSFPYNGGLTTCESLWMGVPVVALHGDSMISRQSASLLTAANLPEWIASDKAHFVKRAAEFSADVRKLATLRGEMRQRLLDSALLDAVTFTRKFETALHLMCEETSRRHRRA